MEQASPFFKLPGELRNDIYEYVVDDIAILRINKNGFLVPPALSVVCQQIHEEVQASDYLGHVIATRPSIPCLEAHVTDFKFGHVSAFLGRLAQYGVTKVDELKIHLRLTGREVDRDAFTPWSKHFSTPDINKRPLVLAIDVGKSISQPQPVKVSYSAEIRNTCSFERSSRKGFSFVGDVALVRKSPQTCRSWLAYLAMMAIGRARREVREDLKRSKNVGAARRWIRAEEEKHGRKYRFWIERINRAHSNGQNVRSLFHTFNSPAVLQTLVTRGDGAWQTAAVGPDDTHSYLKPGDESLWF